MVLSDVNQVDFQFKDTQTLENKFGSAFYYLDIDKLKDNYLRFVDTFTQAYPNSQVAYSFKTNYAPVVCRTLQRLGAWAEVVSAMEYDIAVETVGYKPECIIVNGPLHDAPFIERALLDGATLNVDAWYVLDNVESICKRYPDKQFRIGIRLHHEIEEGGFSRFGIDNSNENLQRLREWSTRVSNCTISGFHSHFSNSSRSLVSFESRIRALIQSTKDYFADELPLFINIGGGFYGEMPNVLAKQLATNIPSFSDYAHTVCQPIKQSFHTDDVQLILEPGTAIIANAMVYVCKVYDVKLVGQQKIALVNGSNHNVNHKWQGESLPIQVIRKEETPSHSDEATFDIVGNTCIEKDIICANIKGPIAIGDYVVFQYMGGYTNVLKQPFIHGCQPIITRIGNEVVYVKRQETFADIMATYSIN